MEAHLNVMDKKAIQKEGFGKQVINFDKSLFEFEFMHRTIEKKKKKSK